MASSAYAQPDAASHGDSLPGGVLALPAQDGVMTIAVANGPGPLRDESIPVAVFWREIFPAMVLVLAFAVVLSLAYVQLRREVARRRAAELRLEAARDLADSASLAKASFFATMSHEIRTPLSGIIGMLDLLRRGTMDDDQRQMLTAVDTAANALLQILDDVLDFSKAEANRMSLESVPVDLRAIVHSVVMVIGEPARRRGVRTLLRVDANVSGEVQGDPLRIRQILSNLMSNAAKFTHQGQVTLAVSVDRGDANGQWLRFSISDTGIGIPHDKLAQVMAPYRQADGATSRRYGGSGLGLSVCSRLANLMGGTIALSSMPGHGTTATFVCRFVATAGPPEPAVTLDLDIDSVTSRVDKTPARFQVVAARTRADARVHASLETSGSAARLQQLALAAPGGVGATDASADDRHGAVAARSAGAGTGVADVSGMPGASSVSGMAGAARVALASGVAGGAKTAQAGSLRILVVDDHAINREVVRRQLMTLGLACDVKEDAPSALEALRVGDYALLLTDCQMPPMNGGELARAWREIESSRGATQRLPIVAMTATAERAVPVPEICEAIDDCMYKPIKLESLREMLAQWLPEPASSDVPEDEGSADAAAPGGLAAMAPLHGLDLDGLQAQFGDALMARRFALQSVQLLRDDLAQARGPLCDAFYDQVARWLHRSVGALSMLGHWSVITTGSQLEKALQQAAAATNGGADRAELLPRLTAVLREFEDTLREIEGELATAPPASEQASEPASRSAT
ncbi:ATP-binding protein [Bordetella sp. LUAb4]|uniref:hybrid sensor histidine kinase/response regulator n=1 Tax=Bordetella sp. LUAb4 TaxID=2843195 RepID=UPI001E586EE6